jgi:hypothetical protein
LAENQSFFGAISRVAARGLANATTSGAASNPSQLLSHRSSRRPPRPTPRPTRFPMCCREPDASRSMATGSGRRRRPGSCPPPGVTWSPRRPRRPTSSSTVRPPFQQRRLRHPGLESVGSPCRGGLSGAGAPAGVGGQAGPPTGPTPMMRHPSRS